MTPDQFRKIALSMPGAEEHSHMGHPDFRLPKKGRIFATIQPDKGLAMVKISVDQQAAIVEAYPEVFVLLGGWSKSGATGINLAKATAAMVRGLVEEAFALASTAKSATKKKRSMKRTTRSRR